MLSDVEVWCNYGLKRDPCSKGNVRVLVLKSNVLRNLYRVQNKNITKSICL